MPYDDKRQLTKKTTKKNNVFDSKGCVHAVTVSWVGLLKHGSLPRGEVNMGTWARAPIHARMHVHACKHAHKCTPRPVTRLRDCPAGRLEHTETTQSAAVSVTAVQVWPSALHGRHKLAPQEGRTGPQPTHNAATSE